MNLGPCSGEDRDKLGVPTPVAPVRGGFQQMGFKCMQSEDCFFRYGRKRFLRRISGYTTIMSTICISKSMWTMARRLKEKFE